MDDASPAAGRRRTELVVAGTCVSLAALFAVLAVAGWDGRLGFPRRFKFDHFDAFGLYLWAGWGLSAGLIVAGGVAGVLLALGRRAAVWPLFRGLLPGAILAGTAILYAPFAAMTDHYTDRIRGTIAVPVPGLRFLVAMVALVVLAHGLFLAVAGVRHTSARVSAVVTCSVLLWIFWIMAILPITTEWFPPDWERREDRLEPLRACRGALVWERFPRYSWPVAQIDDLWLRFDDPRAASPVRAISLRGRFEEGYFWVTLPETRGLLVRSDDPALRDCDGVWRRDSVAPAPWHKIGWTSDERRAGPPAASPR